MKARCIPLLLAAALAFPTAALANDDLERALEAYERAHYAESVRLLRPAAQRGDLHAQELLGFMYLYGTALYGAQVPRDREKARYWLEQAAAGGSSVATHALEWIRRQPARADASIGARSRSK